MPQCTIHELPQYNPTEVKTIHDIDAGTLKACSLNAVRDNMNQLEDISSTEYILGCATINKKGEELPLYFEMINKQLVFRDVLF